MTRMKISPVKQKSTLRKNAELQQKRRFLLISVPAIMLTIFLFYSLIADPASPTGKTCEGKLVEEGKNTTMAGAFMTFKAKLDDGTLVEVERGNMDEFKKNRRALFSENKTRIFRRTTYSFLRYLD